MFGIRASVCIQGLFGILTYLAENIKLLWFEASFLATREVKRDSSPRLGTNRLVAGPLVDVDAGCGDHQAPSSRHPRATGLWGSGTSARKSVPPMPSFSGRLGVLVDRLQHDLLLGRDPVRMTQLESIGRSGGGTIELIRIGLLMKSAGKRVVSARARGLVVQVLPGEGVLRHVETEQHPFAKVLTADVRIQVFPLRLGRVYRRPVGVKGRSGHTVQGPSRP